MLEGDEATAHEVAAETTSVPVTAALGTLEREERAQETEADKKAKEKKRDDPNTVPLDPQCP